jgi:hypothetical protein
MDTNQIEIELDSFTLRLDSTTIEEEIGNCYCCREETLFRSPCICRTHMCDSCLLTYTNYNSNCTICNSALNIYLPSPTNTINSEGYFSLSYSIDDDVNEYYHIDFMLIIKGVYFTVFIFFFICLLNYIGNIGNYIVMEIPLRYNYNYIAVLFGTLYFVFSLLVAFAFSTLLFILTNFVLVIVYYLTCRCIC